MELRKLRYFVAVAEELSFSRAAKKLYISQPALSQQMMDLEKEIEAQLLIRNTQGVRLTPVGEQFLTDTKRILSDLDDCVDRARNAERERVAQSVFRILFDQDEDHLTHLFGIPEAIAGLRDAYPHLNISVGFLPFEQIESAMEQSQLDIGFFVLRPEEYRSLKCAKMVLAKDRLRFITSASAAGTPEEVGRGQNLILIRGDDRWNPFLLSLATQIGFTSHVVYVDTPSRAFSLVETGHGVMSIPEEELARHQNSALLRVLDMPLKHNEIITAALWQNRDTSPWLDTFLHTFKAL